MTEHGAVQHVVTIDDGIEVVEFRVISCLNIYTARISVAAVQIPFEIIILGFRMPQNGIIHLSAGNLNPGDDMLINIMQLFEIDW